MNSSSNGISRRNVIYAASTAISGASQPEMSFGLIRAVVAEISRMLQDWQEAYDLEFSPSFNVTGGNPFYGRTFLPY
jgi:hypothetical protein